MGGWGRRGGGGGLAGSPCGTGPASKDRALFSQMCYHKAPRLLVPVPTPGRTSRRQRAGGVEAPHTRPDFGALVRLFKTGWKGAGC
jgi:hypothetical protein